MRSQRSLGPAWQNYNPADFGSLVLWMRASNNATVLDAGGAAAADDEAVEDWVAINNSALNFDKVTSPVYQSDGTGIGGRPTVAFTGSSSQYIKYTAANALSTATSGELFVVFRPGTNASYGTIFSTADEPTANNYISLFYITSTLHRLECFSVVGGALDRLATPSDLVVGTSYIINMRSSGTAISFEINGVDQTVTVVSGSNAGDWIGDSVNRDSATIGARIISGTAQNFLTGEVSEEILFDGVLDAGDRRRLTRQLGSYYGIAVA